MRDQEPVNDGLDADERETENVLSSLRPTAAANRDALMYAAGARSARMRLNAWQGVAAVLAVATGLSILLRPAAVTRAPHVATLTSNVPAVVTVQLGAPTGPFTAAALRSTVMGRGVDAMPTVTRSAASVPQRPIPTLGNTSFGDPS